MEQCKNCGEMNQTGASVCFKCGANLLNTQTVSNTNNYTSNNISHEEAVTLGEWIITYLLMIVPIVNIIMIFIWAFDSSTKLSKRNWAKAQLVFFLIGIVLSIILVILISVIGMAAYSY